MTPFSPFWIQVTVWFFILWFEYTNCFLQKEITCVYLVLSIWYYDRLEAQKKTLRDLEISCPYINNYQSLLYMRGEEDSIIFIYCFTICHKKRDMIQEYIIYHRENTSFIFQFFGIIPNKNSPSYIEFQDIQI